MTRSKRANETQISQINPSQRNVVPLFLKASMFLELVRHRQVVRHLKRRYVGG
jgi:hypothetical protein